MGGRRARPRTFPIERVIGGPAFRSSDSDHLLQMADLIAHALLKQEEEPSPRVARLGIDRAFGILDRALNRKASQARPPGRRQAVRKEGAAGAWTWPGPSLLFRRFALRFRVAVEH